MAHGLEVAVLGVLVVFAFLTVLVLSVQALGWFFKKFEHRFPAPAGAPFGGQPPKTGTARIAAVIAAVEAHRRRGGR